MSNPNYNETTVTGQAWQRCHQVVIENPRTGQQVVRFEEERVLAMQQRKQQMIDATIRAGGEPLHRMSWEDVKNLLEI